MARKIKKFGLIGASGYIAPRHMKAIKECGQELVVALDKNDSVGIIDSYFPYAYFFTEPERFDRHLDKMRRKGKGVDYVSICSPNYLHDAHIRLALRNGAHAICEKPVVLNPWNIDGLSEIEAESGKKIHTILQLRLHPLVTSLREKVLSEPGKVFDIDLTYITSRGKWYYSSWKGNIEKSGGIVTNIGVHFFDMMSYVFGGVVFNDMIYMDDKVASGYMEFERARLRWFLSLDSKFLPERARNKGHSSHRSLTMSNVQIDFTKGFTGLHTKSYQNILDGAGFGLDDARASIDIVHKLRTQKPVGLKGEYHPLLKNL